jgi:hypothetical protein
LANASKASLDAPATNISHPEEMRGQVELHFGERVVLRAGGRTTPANLVTVGIMVSAIVLSLTALVRAARGPEGKSRELRAADRRRR